MFGIEDSEASLDEAIDEALKEVPKANAISSAKINREGLYGGLFFKTCYTIEGFAETL